MYHNKNWVATLDSGQVYYRTAIETNVTGAHITSDAPVAFFVVHIGTIIPVTQNVGVSHLMQQLAPVNTFGKNFFVPVTHILPNRVRIVISQNNTTINQIIGGVIQTGVPGAQTNPNNLQAGEFVELEIFNTGCYIEADKPVGVCSYLTSVLSSSPAQCWMPATEQIIYKAQIAPFIPNNILSPPYLTDHYALVCTPTDTKESTKVSIGGAPPTQLINGNWIDNIAAEMSFYIMPLTNATASYIFTNQAGFIILGYGSGYASSYYYLAGSAMRELDAAFYANDVHFQDLKDTAFCAGNVNFRAEIEGELHTDQGRLKWFINGTEEILERDNITWNKTFTSGEYEIRMWARFANNDTVSKTDTLNIKSCDYNAVFYANNVHYENLQDTTFCNKDVYFSAVIEGLHTDEGSLKWFIDNEEYEAARDQYSLFSPCWRGTSKHNLPRWRGQGWNIKQLKYNNL